MTENKITSSSESFAPSDVKKSSARGLFIGVVLVSSSLLAATEKQSNQYS
jgi:hypothetical protein